MYDGDSVSDNCWRDTAGKKKKFHGQEDRTCEKEFWTVERLTFLRAELVIPNHGWVFIHR
jgi:hypothetical protein